MENNKYTINKNSFSFVNVDATIHDTKFDTKPIGYFKDAWLRFKKNKSSVVAMIIIIIIMLFSLIAPLVSNHKVSDYDSIYKNKLPKNNLLSKIGIATGEREADIPERGYINFIATGVGAEYSAENQNPTFEDGLNSKYNPVGKIKEIYQTIKGGNNYICNVDTYLEVGFKYYEISPTEYDQIKEWQEETGILVLYPMIDEAKVVYNAGSMYEANYWYLTNSRGDALDKNGNVITDITTQELVNIYRVSNGQYVDHIKQAGNYKVRFLYYNYYIFKNGVEPQNLFGTDPQGYDIFIRLASGIRLSLVLAFAVSIINFIIGAMYGAIEGYYGGATDLILERISDILANVPFIVVTTLFREHLVQTGKVGPVTSLIFCYVLVGWLGTAYRVRTQFYRFKRQEYILAARTLGAKDMRLMFKHIFPNTLGTIITSSILSIPGVIFTESSLSYLGIIQLGNDKRTSIGTMLASGQGIMKEKPHVIFFPALIISLLMISFNLFGNGLRDAFNPSLRGVEE